MTTLTKPENCFFAVLYIMSRAVSLLTILAMLFDSYLLRKDPLCYKKNFHKKRIEKTFGS